MRAPPSPRPTVVDYRQNTEALKLRSLARRRLATSAGLIGRVRPRPRLVHGVGEAVAHVAGRIDRRGDAFDFLGLHVADAAAELVLHRLLPLFRRDRVGQRGDDDATALAA